MTVIDQAPQRVAEAFTGVVLAQHFHAAGDIQVACLVLAARRAGIAATAVAGSRHPGRPAMPWLMLDLSGRVVYCREGRLLSGPPGTPLAECRSINGNILSLIENKTATKVLVEALGFPAPIGRDFDATEQQAAEAYFRSVGHAVCVKPVVGSLGKSVYPNIADSTAFRFAFADAAAHDRRVIVERHIPGQSFRFFFVKPIVAGIRMDMPANVVGDGQTSIADLLTRKNAEKLRRTGQKPVQIGALEQQFLVDQGFTPESIPGLGQQVLLRRMSNASQGGDSLGYPADLHPSYAQNMARLCNALHGLQVVAVDAVLSEPAAPARPDNYAIIELNSAPGMVQFHFPWTGAPQDMAGAIIARLQHGDAWPDRS